MNGLIDDPDEVERLLPAPYVLTVRIQNYDTTDELHAVLGPVDTLDDLPATLHEALRAVAEDVGYMVALAYCNNLSLQHHLNVSFVLQSQATFEDEDDDEDDSLGSEDHQHSLQFFRQTNVPALVEVSTAVQAQEEAAN